jgi:hypothetical protein
MTNLTEPVNLLLSREETLLTLRSLQTESIPGIDGDPAGELTAEGLDLALMVAGRALRARQLAQVREDGELALHHALLTAVGVCAYATRTAFVFHWPEDGNELARYFGHVRGEDFVAHTRPEEALHLFTMLPTKMQLIEQILQTCGYEDRQQNGAGLTLEAADFGQARQLAKQGDGETAVSYLTERQADPDTAAAFAGTLAHRPHISILQLLKQQDDLSIAKSDFTIVQGKEYCWLIRPTAGDANGSLTVKTAVKAEIVSLLNDWL